MQVAFQFRSSLFRSLPFTRPFLLRSRNLNSIARNIRISLSLRAIVAILSSSRLPRRIVPLPRIPFSASIDWPGLLCMMLPGRAGLVARSTSVRISSLHTQRCLVSQHLIVDLACAPFDLVPLVAPFALFSARRRLYAYDRRSPQTLLLPPLSLLHPPLLLHFIRPPFSPGEYDAGPVSGISIPSCARLTELGRTSYALSLHESLCYNATGRSSIACLISTIKSLTHYLSRLHLRSLIIRSSILLLPSHSSSLVSRSQTHPSFSALLHSLVRAFANFALFLHILAQFLLPVRARLSTPG